MLNTISMPASFKCCELSSFFTAAAIKPLYLVVLMALTTGARRGELLGLKWSDIDFKSRLASLITTKNGKPRMLPLTQQVIAELQEAGLITEGNLSS